jgi:hypothetical protein
MLFCQNFNRHRPVKLKNFLDVEIRRELTLKLGNTLPEFVFGPGFITENFIFPIPTSSQDS